MATFPNVSDIIATTIESRSKQNADNLTKNSALLYHLNKRGNVKTFDGGRIIYQELMYNDANTQNAGWFSGYDELDITPNSPITAAQFDIKQASAAVTINGLEEAQNSGTEAMIDLLESRVAVAEGQLQNLVAAGVYAVKRWSALRLLSPRPPRLEPMAVSTVRLGASGVTWLLMQPLMAVLLLPARTFRAT
jgi:hypothetical protein